MNFKYFKIFLFISFLNLCTSSLFGQGKWDAQWIMGYDSSLEQLGGGTLIDFNLTPPDVSFLLKKHKFEGANTSMCDSLGNLLFYSNGCKIINKEHETMENGDTLSPGNIWNFVLDWCDDDDGSPLAQSILALPSSKENEYFVPTYNSDAISLGDTVGTVVGWELFLNKVDMSLNNGLGKVVEKNIPILVDTLSMSFLQATKHANGKDWWVIAPEFISNCYYIIHLTELGVANIEKQCLGYERNWIEGSGQATFSPDGTKYALFQPDNNLNLFDFDRCLGEFSNPLTISFPTDTIYRAGVAFSPSSRFLYAFAYTKLYQFDMWASDIPSSKILIDEYDGFADPFPTTFYMAQLAMDNKIYNSSSGTHEHMSVIHDPDSLGTLCNFEQHAIQLASLNYWSMPNFANYRLGATNNPCYPLTTTNKIEDIQCYGESTGAIEIYTSSGIPPYTYTWNDSSLNGNKQSNLPSGNYDITITDALDSVAIISIIVSQPTEALSISTMSTPESGSSQNGMAEALVTGGTPPYNYLWKKDTVILQTDSTISGLSAGIYEIIITDANGCSISENVEIDQISSTSLPIEELTLFNISPNPSNGDILIELNLKTPSELSVKIITATGELNQVICRKRKVERNLSIPIKDLPKGVLFVVVKIGDKRQVKKMIVL